MGDCVYLYGKRITDSPEPTLSRENLEEAKRRIQEFAPFKIDSQSEVAIFEQDRDPTTGEKLEVKVFAKKKNRKSFDRTICFTFFSAWVEAIRELALEDHEKALDAFLTLSDYCLYNVEPDPANNPWGFTWPIVAGEAQRSIQNRRRGFGAENVEQTKIIEQHHAEHPEESQRAIAQAVGCSVGKVNKVLRALKEGQE